MRKIVNVSFEIDGVGSSYGELIKTSINGIPREGFTADDMRKRLRILDQLDKEGDIEIEDADFDTVKACVNNMRWGRLDRNILKFVDAINDL